jgi:lipoprotein
MNKLFKGVMLVCFFTLFSCQQDEMLYSCDPEVNEYIKSNLSDIQTMSRNRFLEIERDLQPSIFNAFTPEQKQLIWIEKFQNILSLRLTNKEKKHIELLIQYINENRLYFEEPKAYEDDIAIFAYKWTQYAMNVLMWDKEIIYNIVYDPSTVVQDSQNRFIIPEENTHTMRVGITSGRLKTRTEQDPPPSVKCSCNTGVDDCGTTGLMTCKKWDCIAIYGCGFLFQAVCDGGCYRNDL